MFQDPPLERNDAGEIIGEILLEKLLKTPQTAPGKIVYQVPGTWPLLVKSNKVHSPVKATYESPS